MAEAQLIHTDIEAYLARHEQKELLRFVVVGSVDDGKSTLIGRLLHDSNAVYQDQLDAVRRASGGSSDEIDFSLFTDGLRAEREQGITIDVAYRYFSTEKRKFIIADTPGHVQYTRNMVTGASTANVAIILMDARLGVLQQSRRHAYIAALLGIPHLAVAVNKMDLVGCDRAVFERIEEQFTPYAQRLGFRDVRFFPISAREGDHVVRSSSRMSWYQGPTILQYLESVPIDADRNLEDFRFPVQYVIRPNLDYRGFAGQIASGVLRRGDAVVALPSGRQTKVRSIDCHEGPRERAFAPMSVCVRLEDEIDISRGDMLVAPDRIPTVGRTLDAQLVWMSERPLDIDKSYILKQTTQSVRVEIEMVHTKTDLETLADVDTPTLELNDIGRVTLSCRRALFYDAYRRNRRTGAFILIDSLTNDTVGAGMILEQDKPQDLDAALREIRAGSAMKPHTQVSPRERLSRMGQKGFAIWLTGLPGSGRWALAYALERRLFDMGRTVHVVDPTGEDLRSMITAAKACADAGLVAICAFPSYRKEDRQAVRGRLTAERFFEVFVNTREELCRERRPGARFDGFERPETPAVTVALDELKIEDAVEIIVRQLARHVGAPQA